MDPMDAPVQNGDGPSQELFEEARRKADPRTPNHDSPSRQLLLEFSRMLIDSDRKFHNELDRAAAEQEKKHLEALAAAAAEHERVRQSAERVAEKFRLQLEQERKRREEYEHRELERIRQENARIEAERRQRQIDDVKRQEEEQRRAAEEAKALAEAEERLRKQRAQEEVDAARRKAEQEERERRVKEESAAAAAAAVAEKARAEQATRIQQPPAPVQTNGTTPAVRPVAPPAGINSPLVSSQAERDAIHTEYLEIHQRLKVFRKNFQNQIKSNPDLKKIAGDLRRQMRMRMGQLTLNPRQNKEPLQHLRQCFTQAVNTPGLTIDVKQFLSSPTQTQLPPGPCEVPVLMVFLFNHFSKAIIAQLASEAGVNTKAADPIGVVAVSIFGKPEFCINSKIPLTDILLAKYHKCCGVLFGIYGPEKTERGRRRLGWRQVEGTWCSDQDHLERMTGLGAGWAALALRKIKVGSTLVHPLPNAHYWRAFSRIVNTPTHEATATHYMVLKAMVEGDAIDRFIGAYGKAAIAALRKGLVDFPRGHDSVAAKSMQALVESLRKEQRLTL